MYFLYWLHYIVLCYVHLLLNYVFFFYTGSLHRSVSSCYPDSVKLLRKLRNEDAHWTKVGCPDTDLDTTWRQMVQAVTQLVQQAQLHPNHLAKLTDQLHHMKHQKLQKDEQQQQQQQKNLQKCSSNSSDIKLLRGLLCTNITFLLNYKIYW